MGLPELEIYSMIGAAGFAIRVAAAIICGGRPNYRQANAHNGKGAILRYLAQSRR
jgi:hypothetical protein